MNYLCKYTNGLFFVTYSDKDLSQYIGKSVRLSNGGEFYSVVQVL